MAKTILKAGNTTAVWSDPNDWVNGAIPGLGDKVSFAGPRESFVDRSFILKDVAFNAKNLLTITDHNVLAVKYEVEGETLEVRGSGASALVLGDEVEHSLVNVEKVFVVISKDVEASTVNQIDQIVLVGGEFEHSVSNLDHATLIVGKDAEDSIVNINNGSTLVIGDEAEHDIFHFGAGNNTIIFGTPADPVKPHDVHDNQVLGFTVGDRIELAGLHFNGATLSGTHLTLTQNGHQVFRMDDVELANGTTGTAVVGHDAATGNDYVTIATTLSALRASAAGPSFLGKSGGDHGHGGTYANIFDPGLKNDPVGLLDMLGKGHSQTDWSHLVKAIGDGIQSGFIGPLAGHGPSNSDAIVGMVNQHMS